MALTDALARLAGAHRRLTVDLVVHLAEFESRDLHLAAGYSSLFAYCTQALHLSEHEAYHRIEAARDARRLPIVLDRLSSGALTLTNLRLLSPHLTPGDHVALLDAAAGRSKRQVEEIVRGLSPRPDVPSSVRKLPETQPPAGRCVPAGEAPLVSTAATAAPPSNPTRRATVAPLSAARYEVRFTASAATRAKLDRARDLLRHAVPSGDLAEVFDRALTLLVADLERKTYANTPRPRPARTSKPGSRHVPAAVRREVAERDAHRCAFVSANGRRCEATGFLQFHHLEAYAAGGAATVANIQLRCGAHNRHDARLYFGPIQRDRLLDDGTDMGRPVNR